MPNWCDCTYKCVGDLKDVRSVSYTHLDVYKRQDYDKKADVIITVLEVATSILKGIKKLRGIFIKAKK